MDSSVFIMVPLGILLVVLALAKLYEVSPEELLSAVQHP